MKDSQTAGLADQSRIDPLRRPECARGTDTATPPVALLSNGRYGVVITAAGSGCSTWRGLDVTRWREDATRDCWGQFCYIQDPTEGTAWSAGYQPVCRAPISYEVVYSADKAEFRRLDGAIATHLAITVSPENCCEIRRVTLTNHDTRPHDVELTSYAEVEIGRAHV